MKIKVFDVSEEYHGWSDTDYLPIFTSGIIKWTNATFLNNYINA